MNRAALKLPSSYKFAVSSRKELVAALGRFVAVADVRAGKKLFSARGLANPSSASFSRDDSRLAVKSTNGSIALFDLADGRLVAKLKGEELDGAPIHYSPCGEYLVDGTWEGVIRVRSGATLATLQEFAHDGEMITDISHTSDCQTWPFAHQPKTKPGENWAPAPYLTIWRWPIREPFARIDVDWQHLGDAAIAPSGDRIAIAGGHRATEAAPDGTEDVRIYDSAGTELVRASLQQGGSGYRARWSADGEHLGTVDGSGILLMEAKTLSVRHRWPCKYASDIAFLEPIESVVLGTWEKAWVERCEV